MSNTFRRMYSVVGAGRWLRAAGAMSPLHGRQAAGLSDLFKSRQVFVGNHRVTGMIMMLLPAGVTVTVRVTAGRDYY